jgi:hypothetical protein
MSLGIIIKGPEGLVLAAESRITITAILPQGGALHTSFDNATKLFSFSKPHEYIGVVTYGTAAVGLRTAASFIPEFEAQLPEERIGVGDFATKLSDFYNQQWQNWQSELPAPYVGPDMTFVVGGFDEGDPYGRVYTFDIPSKPEPEEKNGNPGEFGMTWGGQREFVDRLIQGYDGRALPAIVQVFNPTPEQQEQLTQLLGPLAMPVPLQAMALQDCVNLAIFFIRTTITAQTLTVGVRGVGGPIDVATITRQEGLQFIQRKRVTGEPGNNSRTNL